MKRFMLLALLMVSVLAIDANEKKQSRKERKAEKKAQQAEQTKRIVEAETFYFDATTMNPTTGGSRSIMNYSIIIEDGNLNSYLPYMGRAYSGGYGGSEDNPLVFESPIENYTLEETKKGGYTIKFTARNGSDRVDYTLSISSSGSGSLSVKSSKRQHISYFGNLVPLYTEELANQ